MLRYIAALVCIKYNEDIPNENEAFKLILMLMSGQCQTQKSTEKATFPWEMQSLMALFHTT